MGALLEVGLGEKEGGKQQPERKVNYVGMLRQEAQINGCIFNRKNSKVQLKNFLF